MSHFSDLTPEQVEHMINMQIDRFFILLEISEELEKAVIALMHNENNPLKNAANKRHKERLAEFQAFKHKWDLITGEQGACA